MAPVEELISNLSLSPPAVRVNTGVKPVSGVVTVGPAYTSAVEFSTTSAVAAPVTVPTTSVTVTAIA